MRQFIHFVFIDCHADNKCRIFDPSHITVSIDKMFYAIIGDKYDWQIIIIISVVLAKGNV